MLTRYVHKSGKLEEVLGAGSSEHKVIWFDLINPSAEEEAEVEGLVAADVPTREEMAEIEASSRLYEAGNALHMTASVLHRIQSGEPTLDPVTFVLSSDKLITVRYSEPRAFPLYLERVAKENASCATSADIFVGLLENIVWRAADLIERIQGEVNRLTHTVFEMRGGEHTRNRRLDVILKSIGRQGEITFRANESVLSLSHVATFFSAKLRDNEGGKKNPLRARIRLLQRDIQSLSEHTQLLMQKMQLVLDATLGMISIEENRTIKIFSVLATIFMPPTLVASLYGMNFKHMPELEWSYGYVWALFLMVASAVICYLIFRRKGWL